jgi:hypothetical protein
VIINSNTDHNRLLFPLDHGTNIDRVTFLWAVIEHWSSQWLIELKLTDFQIAHASTTFRSPGVHALSLVSSLKNVSSKEVHQLGFSYILFNVILTQARVLHQHFHLYTTRLHQWRLDCQHWWHCPSNLCHLHHVMLIGHELRWVSPAIAHLWPDLISTNSLPKLGWCHRYW